MPFQPGQSGNPKGKLNEKIATDALRMAVAETITKGRFKGRTKLRRIADKITSCALKGEPWACGMVYDRLEGRAMQVIDQSITYEAGEVFIDLLRQISERRGQVIEHDAEDRPRTNGSVADVRDQS
jgi:hypothetical protein